MAKLNKPNFSLTEEYSLLGKSVKYNTLPKLLLSALGATGATAIGVPLHQQSQVEDYKSLSKNIIGDLATTSSELGRVKRHVEEQQRTNEEQVGELVKLLEEVTEDRDHQATIAVQLEEVLEEVLEEEKILKGFLSSTSNDLALSQEEVVYLKDELEKNKQTRRKLKKDFDQQSKRAQDLAVAIVKKEKDLEDLKVRNKQLTDALKTQETQFLSQVEELKEEKDIFEGFFTSVSNDLALAQEEIVKLKLKLAKLDGKHGTEIKRLTETLANKPHILVTLYEGIRNQLPSKLSGMSGSAVTQNYYSVDGSSAGTGIQSYLEEGTQDTAKK